MELIQLPVLEAVSPQTVAHKQYRRFRPIGKNALRGVRSISDKRSLGTLTISGSRLVSLQHTISERKEASSSDAPRMSIRTRLLSWSSCTVQFSASDSLRSKLSKAGVWFDEHRISVGPQYVRCWRGMA